MKTKFLHIRVSPELKKRLEKEAKKKGITISALIRGKVEGGELEEIKT